MKLITSISLSILFMLQAVVPNIDMGCEFQKITAIYSHYQEHKTFDGDTLVDFVLKEYINNDGNSEAHHENSNHHEAPYHSSHQCSHVTFFFTEQSPYALEAYNYNENSTFDHYSAFFSTAYLDTLFQPPQA